MAWGIRIPLRDDVKLQATIYKPKALKERFPVVFTLTPYNADSYHPRAYYFARHGYVFALVDARGRGNSEGRFEPFAGEGPDGHDVVEWLARQPWCDGQVAMWGGSYAGFNQWSTLKEFPPHLATIVPAAAAHPGVDFPIMRNTFPAYLTTWLTLTSGVTQNTKIFGEEAYWISKFRELYVQHRPFKDLDQVVGNPSEHFQRWLEHPTPDAYLDAMVPQAEQYTRMNLPILTVTGHYDDDQPGAMEYFRRHMRHGSEEGKAKHFLVVGPWDHAGTRTPTRDVGGLKFGEACLVDLDQLHRQWYDWTLKSGEQPAFLKQRVAYYVAGADGWKYADSLEAITAGTRRLYLGSRDGRANDVFHSGTLSEVEPGASPPDRYVYDPLDVRPAELDREPIDKYLTDQRHALHRFGNGAIYHSEPLAEATEITGVPKVVVWIKMDVPDTDFAVDLYEIQEDGASILLAGDWLRARYRESLRELKLVTPGAIECYTFTGFNFFSRRLAPRSRLRMVLSCRNSIYWQKNYNSGGVVSDETAQDARTATVDVHHDAQYMSYVELPLGK